MANTEHAQTLRGLVPEDLLKFRWLREIVTAPDGSRVAYTVSRPDAQRNSYQTDVYLVDPATEWRRKVSEGVGQGSSLAFSRDGKHLAYVWRGQEGNTTVEIVSPEGERERTFPVEGGVPQELDWSPDGKRLAFARWTEVRREGDFRKFEGIPAPTIRVVRRLRYKQDGVGWVHDRYRHLWVLDVESGDLVQWTDGECDYGEPRWSWDGKRLAFTAMAREQNTELGQERVWILDLESGAMADAFPEWRGAGMSPQWRADDKAIAFAGYEGEPPVNRRRFYHVFLGDLVEEIPAP